MNNENVRNCVVIRNEKGEEVMFVNVTRVTLYDSQEYETDFETKRKLARHEVAKFTCLMVEDEEHPEYDKKHMMFALIDDVSKLTPRMDTSKWRCMYGLGEMPKEEK